MARATLLFVFLALWSTPGSVFAQSPKPLFKSGNIQVTRTFDLLNEPDKERRQLPRLQLIRDHIAFGSCYEDPKLRRLATTYYHPRGPVGLVFGEADWFRGPPNTYFADLRLTVSLLAQGGGLGQTALPLGPIVCSWSEPSVAVVGMEAGTPAAYARPYQHFHFFEANKEIIQLNQRRDKDAFFHFISDAQSRGAMIQTFQGPLRRQLRDHAPRKFYQIMILEACSGDDCEKIVLDLLTKEGIAQCFESIADDGVLCVHTSHRFLNLPLVLGAIGENLKLHVKVGHDTEVERFPESLKDLGHWTSEWVLLARKKDVLDSKCRLPAGHVEKNGMPFWSSPAPFDQLWTDKGPNLLQGVLRGHPVSMRYSAAVEPIADLLNDVGRSVGLSRRFFDELSRLPRPVEEMFMQWQLKNSPRVETLWP